MEQTAGDFFLPLGYIFLGIARGTCGHLNDFPVIEGQVQLLSQSMADVVSAAAILPVDDHAYGMFRFGCLLLMGLGFSKQDPG